MAGLAAVPILAGALAVILWKTFRRVRIDRADSRPELAPAPRRHSYQHWPVGPDKPTAHIPRKGYDQDPTGIVNISFTGRARVAQKLDDTKD